MSGSGSVSESESIFFPSTPIPSRVINSLTGAFPTIGMWKKINLRTRFYLIVVAIMMITILGGGVMVWYTFQMENILTSITDRHLSAFQSAEAMENALSRQKGFVSYYFLDHDPEWLRQLGEYRQIFREKLSDAKKLVSSDAQHHAIMQIETEYNRYIIAKDQVISLYKAGERNEGEIRHKEVRSYFFNLLELCEAFKDIFRSDIQQARKEVQKQATQLRFVAIAAILIGVGLAMTLMMFLINHILMPVQKLTREVGGDILPEKSWNEIQALSMSVRGLIEDADLTHHELVKSRETLLQAEKLALVGKLAAGMAHSIRNPFTSVKMRLFSLGRSIHLNETQQDDFDVISHEIRHIDTIVQNFLEFSRPPKLKMQRVSPSAVVDMAIQLMKHRLASYEVDVDVNRKKALPEIEIDPEQLKEVLVNLMVNACEAMKKGGHILILEESVLDRTREKVVLIRISDNGPGIAADILEKVLQPFFTTREEGTGLGLSIASRIIEEHGGHLDVQSVEGQGAEFIITLPVQEKTI